jgi:hypothetical protein
LKSGNFNLHHDINIYFSTATVQSYENRQKMMNLHYTPIVMFENSWPFSISDLRDVNWKISANEIGTHTFNFVTSVDSPFEIQNDRNYIEFELKKINVPFQYDDYECQITFSAILYSFDESPIKIEHTVWGVVKTIWSKGLQ